MRVIGRALASELDYQRIVRDVAEFAYRLVGAQFVYVVTPEGERLRLVATAGWDKYEDAVHSTGLSLNLLVRGPLDKALQGERSVIIADIQSDSNLGSWREVAESLGWRSLVAVPLFAHNQLVGVLAAHADRPNFFTTNEMAILTTLAGQAAVAIQNARLFAEIEAQRKELHEVSLRLVNAQEEERRRISRELHDELGQALTALKINLDVARRALPKAAPAKLQHSVQEAGVLAVQTLEAARSLSLELHPAMLDDLGLVSALRWEVDRYEQRTGQTIHFNADIGNLVLQPELEITVYRIITEALTNAARHAQSENIEVNLKVENHQVDVSVEDDGVGFDVEGWSNSPGERRSLGLVSMRERAGLLGGKLEIMSSPGQGTRIQAQLPVNS
jgi:signal transduction histidine kinase